MKARAGQTVYNGTMDAARKIYAEEGFKAFWKVRTNQHLLLSLLSRVYG